MKLDDKITDIAGFYIASFITRYKKAFCIDSPVQSFWAKSAYNPQWRNTIRLQRKWL